MERVGGATLGTARRPPHPPPDYFPVPVGPSSMTCSRTGFLLQEDPPRGERSYRAPVATARHSTRLAEVAAVLALIGLGVTEAAGAADRSWPLVTHGLVLTTLAVAATARRHVVAAVAIASAALAVQAVGDFLPSAAELVLALMVAARAASLTAPRARRAALGAIGLSFLTVLLNDPTMQSLAPALPALALFGGAAGLGLALARRTQAAGAQVQAAEEARAADDERAREALTAERTRLARELHDVVTHSLSVVVVQAGAARLDAGPDQAERLTVIEDTARSALVEMRRLLGVLRGEPGAELTPQPGLDQLPELLSRLSAAGIFTRVEHEGAARPLPPGLDLTAYRTVQEAVTNVLNHSCATEVVLTFVWRGDRLEICVVDDGAGTGASGGGRGLLGLSERVGMYDGTLRHGPRDGGGYELRAELPLAQSLDRLAT